MRNRLKVLSQAGHRSSNFSLSRAHTAHLMLSNKNTNQTSKLRFSLILKNYIIKQNGKNNVALFS